MSSNYSVSFNTGAFNKDRMELKNIVFDDTGMPGIKMRISYPVPPREEQEEVEEGKLQNFRYSETFLSADQAREIYKATQNESNPYLYLNSGKENKDVVEIKEASYFEFQKEIRGLLFSITCPPGKPGFKPYQARTTLNKGTVVLVTVYLYNWLRFIEEDVDDEKTILKKHIEELENNEHLQELESEISLLRARIEELSDQNEEMQNQIQEAAEKTVWQTEVSPKNKPRARVNKAKVKTDQATA